MGRHRGQSGEACATPSVGGGGTHSAPITGRRTPNHCPSVSAADLDWPRLGLGSAGASGGAVAPGSGSCQEPQPSGSLGPVFSCLERERDFGGRNLSWVLLPEPLAVASARNGTVEERPGVYSGRFLWGGLHFLTVPLHSSRGGESPSLRSGHLEEPGELSRVRGPALGSSLGGSAGVPKQGRRGNISRRERSSSGERQKAQFRVLQTLVDSPLS